MYKLYLARVESQVGKLSEYNRGQVWDFYNEGKSVSYVVMHFRTLN